MADNEFLARARAKNATWRIEDNEDVQAAMIDIQRQASRKACFRTVWQAALAGAVVLAAGAVLYLLFSDSPEKEGRRASSAALMLCQSAIKSMSFNPSTAVVPARPERGLNGMRLFAWEQTDGLQLQNGFGAMLGSTARCVVDSSGRMASLEIDGKTIPVK